MSDKQELPEKPAKQQTEAEIREFLSSNAYSALEGIQEGIEAALKDILPQAEAATEIANKAAATVLNELTEDLPKIEPPEMPDFQEIYRVIDEITTEWDKTVDFYNHADKEKILEHWNILDEDQREYILELLSSLKEYGARPEEAAAAYDKLASIVDLEQLKGKNTAEKEKIQEIISVRSKRPTEIEYGLDKVSNTAFGNFFSLLGIDPSKEPIALKAEKQGSKKEVSIFYSIDFDAVKEQFPNIKILDRLTYYDKRVYLAVAALWYSGNEYITVRQIYNAMGRSNYKGEEGLKTTDRKPAESDREKILNALRKLLAPIVLDNHEEIEAGYSYPKIRYTGTCLPIEFVDADKPVKINGVLVRDAIHILREPPITQFARIRHQITTVDPILFDTPYSVTEENLAIDDYIFTRCRRAKTDSITILLDTLYKAVGITTAKQRQRAPEKLTKHLEHFKNCGEISKYVLDLKNGKILLKPIKKDALPEDF